MGLTREESWFLIRPYTWDDGSWTCEHMLDIITDKSNYEENLCGYCTICGHFY